MKTILYISIGFIFLSLSSCKKDNLDWLICPGCETFEYDNVDRRYLIHVPDNLPANAPLVFMMHGYSGSAKTFEVQDELSDIADDEGFVVVYPQGLRDNSGITHWNAGLALSNVDDVGFLCALAKHIQTLYTLDTARTFASGISNGGFMSYYLISQRPDIFKAAGSLIGTMSGECWNDRLSISPTPILQLSGTEDNVVPIDGSMTLDGGWGGAPDMRTVMDFWIGLNQCTQSDTIQFNSNTTLFKHSNGIHGNQVWYYEVEGMGHEVPAGKNGEINSYEILWEFFEQI